jgi:hypothetical protein
MAENELTCAICFGPVDSTPEGVYTTVPHVHELSYREGVFPVRGEHQTIMHISCATQFLPLKVENVPVYRPLQCLICNSWPMNLDLYNSFPKKYKSIFLLESAIANNVRSLDHLIDYDNHEFQVTSRRQPHTETYIAERASLIDLLPANHELRLPIEEREAQVELVAHVDPDDPEEQRRRNLDARFGPQWLARRQQRREEEQEAIKARWREEHAKRVRKQREQDYYSSFPEFKARMPKNLFPVMNPNYKSLPPDQRQQVIDNYTRTWTRLNDEFLQKQQYMLFTKYGPPPLHARAEVGADGRPYIRARYNEEARADAGPNPTDVALFRPQEYAEGLKRINQQNEAIQQLYQVELTNQNRLSSFRGSLTWSFIGVGGGILLTMIGYCTSESFTILSTENPGLPIIFVSLLLGAASLNDLQLEQNKRKGGTRFKKNKKNKKKKSRKIKGGVNKYLINVSKYVSQSELHDIIKYMNNENFICNIYNPTIINE